MTPWLRFLALCGFLPSGFVILGATAGLLLFAWVVAHYLKERR